jgi:hypothetical protein
MAVAVAVADLTPEQFFLRSIPGEDGPMTTLTSSPTLDVELDDIPAAASEAAPSTLVVSPVAAPAPTAQELRDAGIAERRARRAHEHATRNRRHDAAGWTMLVAGLAISIGLFGVIAYEGSMVQLRDSGAVVSTN